MRAADTRSSASTAARSGIRWAASYPREKSFSRTTTEFSSAWTSSCALRGGPRGINVSVRGASAERFNALQQSRAADLGRREVPYMGARRARRVDLSADNEAPEPDRD